jgi:hypothetical protein
MRLDATVRCVALLETAVGNATFAEFVQVITCGFERVLRALFIVVRHISLRFCACPADKLKASVSPRRNESLTSDKNELPGMGFFFPHRSNFIDALTWRFSFSEPPVSPSCIH